MPSGLTLDRDLKVEIQAAVVGLDAWLDSMREPGGYAGPVVHWWRDCLDYTGPGLDWRYEGIVIGYLNLWAATGDSVWLAKARRAGDDLVAGQLPSGNYRNSRFELNPGTGGTPHEAACDLALLRLALALREFNDPIWTRYVEAAERNIQGFLIGTLWDAGARLLRDDPTRPAFVPNKASTAAEVFFALAQVTGDVRWVETYALPILDHVLSHQVHEGPLAGAIAQNSLAVRRTDKYMPFYVARCIPALRQAETWTGELRFRLAADAAVRFVWASQLANGGFVQVFYPRGRSNCWPQWVAATGDMLRILLEFPMGAVEPNWQSGLRWLLAGRREDGGIHTAVGFGRVTPQGASGDGRDQLSVCGWADKAFRLLSVL